MSKAVFIKASKYTAKHFAQLLAAIIDSSTGSDPDAVVLPFAIFKNGDYRLNDNCEFREVRFPCEQTCWKGIDEPPVTRQVEIMTGSMLLYVCCDCGGYLYVDHPDPRMIRDIDYAEKRDLAASYNLVGPMLNKRLRKSTELKRESSREAMARMRAKRRDAVNGEL